MPRYRRSRWRPYVPVAARRASAHDEVDRLRKEGVTILPVAIEGRKIARTFWGAAWCDHLEAFSDYENRLPRGRTYVRNGSVVHLDITQGAVRALVSGSQLYHVDVKITGLDRKKWADIKARCAGKIGSLLELLEGRLSTSIMSVVTDRDTGLFPLPREIRFGCDCPDWAVMCKHVAAVLYGVGVRLDEDPELFFHLRQVDHRELLAGAGRAASTLTGASSPPADPASLEVLRGKDLSELFGVEISEPETAFGRL